MIEAQLQEQVEAYHEKCPRRVVKEDRGSDQEHDGSHNWAQLEIDQSQSIELANTTHHNDQKQNARCSDAAGVAVGAVQERPPWPLALHVTRRAKSFLPSPHQSFKSQAVVLPLRTSTLCL